MFVSTASSPPWHSAYVGAWVLPTFSVSKNPSSSQVTARPNWIALRGEVDAGANTATSVWQRNPDWIEKDLMDFHAILEAPEGLKHTRFAIFLRLCLATLLAGFIATFREFSKHGVPAPLSFLTF